MEEIREDAIMKITKTKKVVKEVEEVVDYYCQCDKCDSRIETTGCESFEFSLEYRRGVSFGTDGGEGKTSELELCQECAKDLMQLLTDNGYKIQTSDYDW